MCYFISAIIPSNFSSVALNSIGQKYGLSFEICKNTFVQEQLKQGETYLTKNCKYCDCGTDIGASYRLKNQVNRIEKRQLDKIKKQGWSETKIKRWIDDKRKAIEKDKTINKSLTKDLDITDWINFINDLFENTNIKYFSLLLHWYEGNLQSECITMKETIHLNVAKLTSNNLLMIKDDSLYKIHR